MAQRGVYGWAFAGWGAATRFMPAVSIPSNKLRNGILDASILST
jgi:hypothetical protein